MPESVTHIPETLELPYAEVRGDRLAFDRPDDAARALAIGAFFVKIPEHLDVRPGLELARTFYEPADPGRPGDRYRGHRAEQHADSKLGYSDRPDQVEQLQLESAHWDTYLPAEVTTLLREMEAITLATLYGVFEAAGLPESDWEIITGGAREGTGWCHSTVNHYRASLSGRAGIVHHTDSGFITLLYADQPGLEVQAEDDRWLPVDVKEHHFIVNLGDGLDILTRRLPRPVTAVIHRVPESSPDQRPDGDRSSFTVFIGPRYDMPLYQYTADHVLGEYQGFRDFSVEKAKKLGYEFHPRL
ncbi:2OG-Fe(II) oxygenase family protein [Streptomyces sp. N50]|uniref:2OG-Fe(II) oxygenase family protein n=1 Tax=Streptomyces sp. N50 TaxID=3081765 RepID=UPI00296200F7|nr:2OG-Fe(II) oxygenase family protein [Streptomyces sp. N50]WOX15315.1 2OG-Fe(II) oxygenase family protein [Streptomyces sp. N50]